MFDRFYFTTVKERFKRHRINMAIDNFISIVLLLLAVTPKVDSFCDTTDKSIICQHMLEDDFKNELDSTTNRYITKLVTNYINFANFRSVKSEFINKIYDLETLYNEENILLDGFDYFSKLTNLTIYGSNISNFTGLYLKNRLNVLNLTNNNIQTVTQLCKREMYIKKIILKENKINSLETNTFYNCRNLYHIDLSYNKLIKFNVIIFSNLYDIAVLDLSYNQIELIINKNEGIGAHELYLNNNNISNLYKNAFHKFINLRILRLENNPMLKFEDNVFTHVTKLSHLYFNNLKHLNNNSIQFEIYPDLKELDMSNGTIIDVSPGVFNNFVNLTQLNLQNNKINTLKPGVLHHLEHLEMFLFSDNELTEVPCELSDLVLPEMKLLDFSRNNISSILTCAFNNFPNLKQLNLNHNNLNSIEVDTFSQLSHLRILNISHNSLKILSDKTIMPLRYLKELDVSYNNISDIEVGTFSSLKFLSLLNLANNNISLIKKNTFIGLRNLRTLNLNSNIIDDLEAGALNYLEMLTEFTMTRGILKSFPCDLSHSVLLRLERMDLSHNGIFSINVCAFINFPNLKQLNLNNNYLFDPSPGIFSPLSHIQILNLSYNGLRSFDEELFLPLMNLSILDLSWNGEMVNLDVRPIVSQLKSLKYIGINRIYWSCPYLAKTISYLTDRNISYRSYELDYETENINGIACKR